MNASLMLAKRNNRLNLSSEVNNVHVVGVKGCFILIVNVEKDLLDFIFR